LFFDDGGFFGDGGFFDDGGFSATAARQENGRKDKRTCYEKYSLLP
jgi:hypothetical protein